MSQPIVITLERVSASSWRAQVEEGGSGALGRRVESFTSREELTAEAALRHLGEQIEDAHRAIDKTVQEIRLGQEASGE